MKTVDAVRYRNRLDNLFQQVSSFSGNIELQAHWARYLCVLVSGFVEVSVRAILSEYTQKKASPTVVSYVTKQLSGFQNPKMERILELTRDFSPAWESALRQAVDGERKDAIDSIVANRNLIAHGDPVGITYTRIRQYYQNAITVVEHVEKQCEL